MRPSRRWPSGRRSSRPASAACPRSCTTAINGLLVPPGSPDAFAAAIERLVDGRRASEPPGRCGRRPPSPALSRDARLRRARAAAARGRRMTESIRSARASSSSGATATRCRCRSGWRRSGTRSSGRSTTACSPRRRPAARSTDERFRLVAPSRPRRLDGLLFYLRLPFRVRRQIRDFEPDAIIASDPYIGAASMIGRCAHARPPAAGDPRGARRLADVHAPLRLAEAQGSSRPSPTSSAASPFAAATPFARFRRYTESLVEEVRGLPVAASFPTYTDLSAFTARPIEPLPGAADGAVRRDARGVQERRRARRRLARSRRAAARRRGSCSSARARGTR